MTRRLYTLALLALLLVIAPACAQDAAEASPEMTEEEKTLYALGLAMGGNLGPFGLTEADLTTVVAGITDSVLGNEAKVDLQTYGPKIQELAQSRAKAASAVEREAAKTFLAEKAAEVQAAGGEVTESGLIFRTLTASEGANPTASDVVKVHYVGTLRTGETFDSSRDRGEPATFPLTGVVPCWTEGVQKMTVGSTAQIICPPDLAYGDNPAGRIPPGSALVFEVELLEIVAAPTE